MMRGTESVRLTALIATVAAVLLLFGEQVLRGEPPARIELTDRHFLLPRSDANIIDHVVFKDITGRTIAKELVATQIMDRITFVSQKLFPMTVDAETTASNVLSLAVDYPNGYMSPTGTFADGTLEMIFPNATPLSSWVQVLPVQTNLISCITTGGYCYIEYIDRLAQFLELQVGVLTNGELIFGTAGHWPTNYMPQYTIELDVRYNQGKGSP